MTTRDRAKRGYAIALLVLAASACGAKEAVQSNGDATSGGITAVDGTGPVVSVRGSDEPSASGAQASSTDASSTGTGDPAVAGASTSSVSGAGAGNSGAGGAGTGGSGSRTGSNGAGTGGGGTGSNGAGGSPANPPSGSTPGSASQTISFPPLAGGWVYGETRTLPAAASSRLGVTFSATGACQVRDAALGVVQASDIGECRVTVAQPGGPGVQAATPVTQSTQIGKATPTIQFSDQRFEYDRSGAPVPLSATVSNGAAAQYRVTADDPSGPLCTVSGDRLEISVPNSSPARCTIEAYVDATGPFEAAAVSATFTVEPTIVKFTSYSAATVSADGTTAEVTVNLNRPWDIDVSTDCGGTDSSQSGSASYTISVALSTTRPLSCTIDVSTSQFDAAVRGDSVSVPVTLP